MCVFQERDGMRAILESYDTELAPNEYSPQLRKRLKEAEDMLQKTQSHNAEMEVCVYPCPHKLIWSLSCIFFKYYIFKDAK